MEEMDFGAYKYISVCGYMRKAEAIRRFYWLK